MIVLGYLATTLISALEGAVVFGGLGVLGAAFASIGVPKDSVLQYQTVLAADNFLVIRPANTCCTVSTMAALIVS